MGWEKIAKVGTFTDSKGRKVTFTKERLDKIVAKYAERTEDAPVVLGHPKHDAPAYGWVKSLKREGEYLLAYLAQVPAKLKEALDNGRYKYKSMSLGAEDLLRHLGVLGAATPGIKGLGAINLEESDDSVVVEFDFNEGDPEGDPPKDGPKPKDKPMGKTPEQLQAELDAANKKAANEKAAREKEEAARKDAEGKLAEREKDFNEKQAAAAKEERSAKIDKLVENGKLMPADKDRIAAFAEQLAEGDGKVEFNEGDGEKSLEAHFFDFLEGGESHGLLNNFAAPSGDGSSSSGYDSGKVVSKF
jgi:hypothetical protein